MAGGLSLKFTWEMLGGQGGGGKQKDIAVWASSGLDY
jgi:hypothetical protein